MKQELRIKDQQLREALERVCINEDKTRYSEQRAKDTAERISRLENEKENVNQILIAVWKEKIELMKNLLTEIDSEKINMMIWMDMRKDLEILDSTDELGIQIRLRKEQIYETIAQTFYNKIDDVDYAIFYLESQKVQPTLLFILTTKT
ncbi:MAG: hypothetical protein EZS28_014066 [Streblomastix strix]|uniref:Uncharacterized protein n=1 Tax=Streblomastix strix TaxID=222440 RepID=A0A5J4W6C1_9EUKA|nr:MAG: hypothetical protein EZS28_014066 [Streblomastix strix]